MSELRTTQKLAKITFLDLNMESQRGKVVRVKYVYPDAEDATKELQEDIAHDLLKKDTKLASEVKKLKAGDTVCLHKSEIEIGGGRKMWRTTAISDSSTYAQKRPRYQSATRLLPQGAQAAKTTTTAAKTGWNNTSAMVGGVIARAVELGIARKELDLASIQDLAYQILKMHKNLEGTLEGKELDPVASKAKPKVEVDDVVDDDSALLELDDDVVEF